ncbi:MAG: hypothetical protein PHP97_02185 [Candidatus Shapirobacteria bacterium]|nr:hypothetical protein [Candidatus Shapirobacteria bacterium]MDD3002589.1 hypothetical protein [Candidatus Shapirobacteria bacterium]MDD4382786.1 hypothetical protein [Candidatus Shapirobacteria bacterium]
MSETNEPLAEENQVKPKKWWKIIGIVTLIAIIALMLWQSQPWSKESKETTINGDLHVTGNLVVDKNVEVKDTITAKKVVALEEIKTPIIKADVGEISHVKANVVDSIIVNAETINANTANIQVVNAGKVNTGSNISSVTVQPVQPVEKPVEQTGSGSENSFTSGDPQWNTGVGVTKTVTLNVSPGKTAVVGGYTVNGVKGSLKIYQPGTYQLTICDGFIRDNVDPANSQSTYQMKKDEAARLGQDISNAQN